MSTKTRILQIYQLSGIIAWLVFFFITFYSVIEGGFDKPHSSQYISPFYRDVTLNFFILFAFLYFRLKSEKPRSRNFNDLLWDGFITSALTVSTLFITQQLTYLHLPFFDNILVQNIIYEFNGLFLIIFCGKIFFTYKNLILYQKTKNLYFTWQS